VSRFEQSVHDVAAWLGDHADVALLKQAAEAVQLPVPDDATANDPTDLAAQWRSLLRHAAAKGQLADALAPLEQASNPLTRAMAGAFVPPEDSPDVLVVPSGRALAVGWPAGVFLAFVVVALLLPSAPFVPQWSSSYQLGTPTAPRLQQLQTPAPSSGARAPSPTVENTDPPELSEVAVEPSASKQVGMGDPSDGLEVDVPVLPPPRRREGRVFLDGVEQWRGRSGQPDAGEPAPPAETDPPPEPAEGTGEPPSAPPGDEPLSLVDPTTTDANGAAAAPESDADGIPAAGSAAPPDPEAPTGASLEPCKPGADVRRWPCRRLYQKPEGCPDSSEGYVGWWWAGPRSPGEVGDVIAVERAVHVRCDLPREGNGYDPATPVASALSRGHWVRISGPPMQVGSSWYVPLQQGDYPIPKSLR